METLGSHEEHCDEGAIMPGATHAPEIRHVAGSGAQVPVSAAQVAHDGQEQGWHMAPDAILPLTGGREPSLRGTSALNEMALAVSDGHARHTPPT